MGPKRTPTKSLPRKSSLITTTFTHFYCRINADPGAGTTTFTFRVNGVDTGTPCSFSANAANVTSTYPVTAGDTISVRVDDDTSGGSVHATWAMD